MAKGIVWVGTPFILNFEDPMEIFQPLVDEGLEVRLDECRGYMPEEDVIEAISGVTAVIAGAEPYTAGVIEKAPNVQIIARAGVGYNNVELPAATSRGIVVTNAAGQNSASVAEHFFGHMIGICRRISWMDKNIRRGLWREIQPALRPLNGMTLGILGFGNIGKEVAKRAGAFDMKVIANDIVEDRETADRLGVRFVSLEELARESDYLTCHVPLTLETTLIINGDLLKRMKPDAYLFNISRGPVVDLDALTEALQEGDHPGGGDRCLSRGATRLQPSHFLAGERGSHSAPGRPGGGRHPQHPRSFDEMCSRLLQRPAALQRGQPRSLRGAGPGGLIAPRRYGRHSSNGT